MKTIEEFDFPLGGSEEEMQRRELTGELKAYTAIVKMPRGAVVRRISGRIKTVVVRGIHPQTKIMGNYAVPKEHVSIWAEVDANDRNLVPYTYHVIPTGGTVPEEEDTNVVGKKFSYALPYLGSFLLEMGAVAFHVYGPVVK